MQDALAQRAHAYRHLLGCYAQMPAGIEGFDADQVELLRSVVRPKTVVFLAFPPKAGGTFLREAVGHVLAQRSGGRTKLLRGSFVPAGEQEQDLYLPELLTHFVGAESPCALIHNHPTAANGNLALIELFGLKPILMLRSIADMLQSRFDAGVKRGAMGGHGSAIAEDETFFELDPEAQKDWLVANVAPWYVKYYASWRLAEERGRVRDCLWLRFDDFRADPAATVRQILAHNALEASDAEIAAALAHANALRAHLRYNRGVSGRGEAFLADAHRRHLERLVRPYSHVDFRALGLV
jgi:hypothetical protein